MNWTMMIFWVSQVLMPIVTLANYRCTDNFYAYGREETC